MGFGKVIESTTLARLNFLALGKLNEYKGDYNRFTRRKYQFHNLDKRVFWCLTLLVKRDQTFTK